MSCTLTEIENLSSGALNILTKLLNNRENLKDSEYGYLVTKEDLKPFNFSETDIKEVFESGLVISTKTVLYYLSIKKMDVKHLTDPNLINFLENDDGYSTRFIIDNGTIMGLNHLEHINLL